MKNPITQKAIIMTGVAIVTTVTVVRTVRLLGHIVNNAFDALETQVDRIFDRR